MTTIPLVTSDWRRDTVAAREPVLKVQNRYFEQNPTNLEEGSSLLTRPGFRYFANHGDTFTSSMYSQEGTFSDDAFVICESYVKRVDSAGVFTDIVTPADGFLYNSVSSTAGTFTGNVGDIPAYFWFIGSDSLWVYSETETYVNTLSTAGAIANNDVVQIGNMYYKFTTGSVDAGTPDGGVTNPWLVGLNLFDNSGSFLRLYKAVNASGEAGVDYSTNLSKNLQVNAYDTSFGMNMYFFANVGGDSPFQAPAATVASADLTWLYGTGFFSLSGAPTAFPVDLPTDAGNPVAIATIAGYVLIATDGTSTGPSQGRFYWINPGDTFISPLDFATAELIPDSLLSIRVIGDQIWMLGANSIEVWYVTGNADAPFRRIQGRSMNLGVKQSSDCVLENTLVFVGDDGVVYAAAGTTTKRLSNHSIESQIRQFTQYATGDILDTGFRVWQTTFEGHMVYALQLGRFRTLILDITTEQWLTWTIYNEEYLPQHMAIAWSGQSAYPCVLASADSGAMWVMDPDYRLDDTSDGLDYTLIPCVVTGGVPMRMRETVGCNEVYLTASLGLISWPDIIYLVDPDGAYLLDADGSYLIDEPLTSSYPVYPTDILLEVSDDNGVSWVSAGTAAVNPEDWEQELVWRSLGRIKAPGRLFRFTDYNAVTRIDGVDMQ